MYHKLRKWLLLLLSFICTSPNSHFSLQTHVLIILKENTVRKKIDSQDSKAWKAGWHQAMFNVVSFRLVTSSSFFAALILPLALSNFAFTSFIILISLSIFSEIPISSQFSFTTCSKHGCCCSTHPPSPWQELLPLTMLQQRLPIPVKFISEFNAVINSGKSYLGSQQNCHQRTHTAGIKSQPWMVAFQQEPSWCQVAQGGGQQFRTWYQVERPLSDTLGENKVENFLAHETYLLFTPFPGFHCLSRNVLWPLKNDNIAESSQDRCEKSATFKGQLFWSDWPFFHYQVWPLRLDQTEKAFGSGLYMAQRDTWGYALFFLLKKCFCETP